MKPFTTALICLLFVFLRNGEAQQPLSFNLEAYGGQIWSSVASLNGYSQYNQAYLENQLNYYQYKYGAYSSATLLEHDGELTELGAPKSMGGRLRLKIGQSHSSLSLSAGLQYIWGSDNSNTALRYSTDNFYQGSELWEQSIQPQHLWIEAWIPTLGLHWPLWNKQPLSMELTLSAGPVLASCGAMRCSITRKKNTKSMEFETEIIHEIRGRGVGLSLEAGSRIQLQLLKGISLFAEMGYRLQKVSSIKGDGWDKTNYKDSNGDGYSTLSSQSGEWILRTNNLGAYPDVIMPGESGTDVEKFVLNLSAFYLQMGLSLRIF